MDCKVLEVRNVKTRFGDKLLLVAEHPDGGEIEIWVNPSSSNQEIKAGQLIDVVEENGKFKLKKRNGGTGGNGNWKQQADLLVEIFNYLGDKLSEEDSEAVAKLAITLFLRTNK